MRLPKIDKKKLEEQKQRMLEEEERRLAGPAEVPQAEPEAEPSKLTAENLEATASDAMTRLLTPRDFERSFAHPFCARESGGRGDGRAAGGGNRLADSNWRSTNGT